jgi:protein-S-isoprenylcysteine O-methyltransferase Ste14
MKPYFPTHLVGVLYAVALLSWYGLELRQLVRQRKWRRATAEVGPQAYWAAFWASGIVAAIVLMAAPVIAPGAEMSHRGVAFGIGMVMLVAGVALRVWSFRTLGPYFTFAVKVSPDQPVVTAGPYRLLRHPAYAGSLMAVLGIGVLYGNWVSLAAVAALSLSLILWRIVVEEHALLATLGTSYGSYAAQHKRLVPLVW